jgi:hypothetical protein
MNIKDFLIKKFPDHRFKGTEFSIRCVNKECEDNYKNNKYKLGINVITGKFHCWRCGLKGSSFSYFLKLINEKPIQIKQVSEIKQRIFNMIKFTKTNEKTIINKIELPEHCINPLTSNLAMDYLKNRNITKEHINYYDLQYSTMGKFAYRIILPVYDYAKNLIYYQGRHIFNGIPKTLNPKIDKSGAIFNYNNISKDKDYLIITEGGFDCMTVFDSNCIALFGKELTDKQLHKIKLLNWIKRVVIMLDGDAWEFSLKMAKKLKKFSYNIGLIKLDDDDPNELGHKEVWNRINNNIIEFNDKMLIKETINGKSI